MEKKQKEGRLRVAGAEEVAILIGQFSLLEKVTFEQGPCQRLDSWEADSERDSWRIVTNLVT